MLGSKKTTRFMFVLIRRMDRLISKYTDAQDPQKT